MARTKWYISDNSLYVEQFDNLNEFIKDLLTKKNLSDIIISNELVKNEECVENSICSGDSSDELIDGRSDKN